MSENYFHQQLNQHKELLSLAYGKNDQLKKQNKQMDISIHGYYKLQKKNELLISQLQQKLSTLQAEGSRPRLLEMCPASERN